MVEDNFRIKENTFNYVTKNNIYRIINEKSGELSNIFITKYFDKRSDENYSMYSLSNRNPKRQIAEIIESRSSKQKAHNYKAVFTNINDDIPAKVFLRNNEKWEVIEKPSNTFLETIRKQREILKSFATRKDGEGIIIR